MTAPTLPHLIEVHRDHRGTAKVVIDGDELPYAISATETIAVEMDHNDAPKVRLTLLARAVHVYDDLLVDLDVPGHDDPSTPTSRELP